MLDAIENERLLERADAIGQIIRSHVERWIDGGAPVANLRGLGAMLAFDVVTPDGESNGARAKRAVAHALAAGLIVLTCGTYGETIRILVPLTIADGELEEGLAILGNAIARAL